MTSNKKLLKDYQEVDLPQSVRLGDKRTAEACGSGQVNTSEETTHGRQTKIHVNGVFYVPKLACNLFSIPAVPHIGLVVQFAHSCCKNSTGKVAGKGKLVNRMYLLNCKTQMLAAVAEANLADKGDIEMILWHQRLRHVNKTQLIQAVKNGHVKGVNFLETDTLDLWGGCVEDKMSCKPFKPSGGIKSTRKLQLVHSDVCGPMSVQSFRGN